MVRAVDQKVRADKAEVENDRLQMRVQDLESELRYCAEPRRMREQRLSTRLRKAREQVSALEDIERRLTTRNTELVIEVDRLRQEVQRALNVPRFIAPNTSTGTSATTTVISGDSRWRHG